MSAGGRISRRCDAPLAAGTSSSTSRSQLAIARPRSSCPSRPNCDATLGRTSERRFMGGVRSWVTRAESSRRSRPDSTRQAVEAATSAGSRSSGVVVVMNACGSWEMRRTRCDRRTGSSSEKTSSSRSSGCRSAALATNSTWASLSARIAVRCWPREANVERSRPSSSKETSSRCGPTSVAPFQSSFSTVSSSRRRSASVGVSRSLRRGVGDVAEGKRALPGPRSRGAPRPVVRSARPSPRAAS